MECGIPDLPQIEHEKILRILQQHNLLHSHPLKSEYCKVEKSKKNTVVSIIPKNKVPILLKLFTDNESWENEIKIYTFRHEFDFFHQNQTNITSFAIPKLLYWNRAYIITEYVLGKNLMDLITDNIKDKWNSSFWENLLTNLFWWIVKFSDIYSVIPLDCHVRNFIIKSNVLYGVDFEELGIKNNEILLRAIVALYFSILGAYPGVIEGLELKKKAKIGSLLIQVVIGSDFFIDIPPKDIASLFLQDLKKEYNMVMQRRINLHRGSDYDMNRIDSQMRKILSYITSDYSSLLSEV